MFGYLWVYILNNFRLWVEQGLLIELGNVWIVECGMYFIFEMDEVKVVYFEDVCEVVFDYNKEGVEGV